MRRLARIVERVATTAALLVLCLLVGVEVLERSGLVTELARGYLTRWLPEGRWEFEDCRIDLAGPTLAIEGVSFSRDGEAVLSARSVDVTLSPFGSGVARLESARVVGLEVRAQPSLVDAFTSDTGAEVASTGGARPDAFADHARIEIVDARILGPATDDAPTLAVVDATVDVLRGTEILLRGAARTDDRGREVTGEFEGRGRLWEDGELLVELVARGLPVSPIGRLVDDDRVSPEGEVSLRVRARGRTDRLESASLSVTLADGANASPDPGFEFSDLELRGRFDWAASGGAEEVSGVAMGRVLYGDRPIDFAWRPGGGPFGDVTARFTGRPADERIRSVVQLAAHDENGDVDRVFDALGIRGGTDGYLGVRVDVADPGPRGVTGHTTELALVGVPRGDVSMCVHGWPDHTGELAGFPLPTTGLEGRVVYHHRGDLARRDRLCVLGVTGDAGGGRVSVEGWLASPLPTYARADRSFDHRAHLDFRVRAEDVVIDRELADAIAATHAGFDLEETLAPTAGRVDARVALVQNPSYDGFVLAIDARLDDVAGRWSQPYLAFERASGDVAVRFSARSVDLDDGRGEQHRGFGFRVEARGTALGAEGATIAVSGATRSPDPLGADAALEDARLSQWTVTAQGVPLASDLAAPIVGSEQQLVDALANETLRSVVDVDWRAVSRDFVDPGTERVLVRSASTAVATDSFRATVTGLQAVASRRRGDTSDEGGALAGGWSGSALAIARDPAGAEWIASGSLNDGASPTLEVAAAGLVPADPHHAALFPLPDGLVVQGSLDGRADVDVAAEGGPRVRSAVAELRRTDLVIGRLRVGDLEGVLDVADGRLHSRSITGRFAGSPFELRDVATSVDAGSPLAGIPEELSVDGDGVPFAPIFTARAFARDLSLDLRAVPTGTDALERWSIDHRWRGRTDVEGVDVVVGRRHDDELVVRARGELVPHDLFAYFSYPIRLRSGRLAIEDFVATGDDVRSSAVLSDAYGEVASQPLSRATARVELDGGTVRVRGLDGELAGGRVTGLDGTDADDDAASFDVATSEFEVGLAFASVDVGPVLADVFGSAVQSRGKLTGRFGLEGTGGDILTFTGWGAVSVDEARLWSLPIVRDLFAVLGLDATATFDHLESRMLLDDGRLKLVDAVAHSPIVKLVGGGTLDVDGTISQEFELHYTLIDRVPLLSKIFYWFQSRLVRVEIQGTMDRPRLRLSNLLLDLLGGNRTPKVLLPLPPNTPLPPRF
ncbi:MAG: hypothetical protein R3F34_17800 [Planctomycetota bacterium]